MLASEVMAQLSRLTAEQGDLPVGYYDHDSGSYIVVDDIIVKEHNPNCGWHGDDEELAPQFFGLS